MRKQWAYRPPIKKANRSNSTIFDRLWGRVAFGDCWEWLGPLSNGYGRIMFNGKHTTTHRVAYQLLRGPIPDSFQPDHLCRNRACLNPFHLELVTQSENNRRIPKKVFTHCPHGHEYTTENTRMKAGKKNCKACECLRMRRLRASRRRGPNNEVVLTEEK